MDSNNKTDKPTNTILLSAHQSSRRSDSVASGASAANTPLEPGTTLGNYLIVAKLGEGGMGVVYKAHDASLDRPVALKVLPPHLFHNRSFLHRFRTEAQAQARLHSPHVVTLYSMLEVPAGLVLVMEYVEGQTLDARIRSQGPFSVDEAVPLFLQALQGVEEAHKMGIVHRDLKPENIFITQTGEIKIMDFGVAKILNNQERTLSGTMIGTLLYISPEQVNGREADFRSDIYTLGVSLFEAVTGRLPFERNTDYALMHAHVLERPPRPGKLRRGIPKKLEAVILKAIEKDPARRFQNVREFREALLMTTGMPMAAHNRHAPSWSAPLQPLTGFHLSYFFYKLGFLRYYGSAKQRILGGLGLDLLLIGIVMLIVLGLGLYPGTKPQQGEAGLANKTHSSSSAKRTQSAKRAADKRTTQKRHTKQAR